MDLVYLHNRSGPLSDDTLPQPDSIVCYLFTVQYTVCRINGRQQVFHIRSNMRIGQVAVIRYCYSVLLFNKFVYVFYIYNLGRITHTTTQYTKYSKQ